MKSLLGLIGVTLMGIGIGTVAVGLKVGLCAGTILLGLGLVIDALKK
jgi:hypothetical protein